VNNPKSHPELLSVRRARRVSLLERTQAAHLRSLAIMRGALRRQGDMIRAVDESLALIMYERVAEDGEWQFRFSSDRFVEVFGLPPSELWDPKGAWARLLHPDDRALVLGSYAKCVATGGGMWRADFRATTATGGVSWFRAVVRVEAADGFEVRSLGILQDVSTEKNAGERVEYVRDHDELTGLHARSYFERALTAMLQGPPRRAKALAVIVVDIDDFHEVNAAFGMAAGDALLRTIVERLVLAVPERAVLARLAGDKLGVIVESHAAAATEGLAREIVARLCDDYPVGDRKATVTVSVGVSWPQTGRETAADLIHEANLAVGVAYASGGGSAQVFASDMAVQSVARVTLKADLREALSGGQFELYYQPKVDLLSGRIAGCEALLRWNHPLLGLRAPGTFIEAAEQSGLIVRIGEWVVAEACRESVRRRRAGLPVVPVSVNLSAVQFARSDVAAMLARSFEQTGADPTAFGVEVTESVFIDFGEREAATFRRMRELGVEIALDDFGTGFSSLAYVKKLPLTEIKIDQSFVRGAPEDPGDAAIVRWVASLGRELGLRVVAEGIETREHLDFVRRAGCSQAQGYFLGRPMSADAFAAMLGLRELSIAFATGLNE